MVNLPVEMMLRCSHWSWSWIFAINVTNNPFQPFPISLHPRTGPIFTQRGLSNVLYLKNALYFYIFSFFQDPISITIIVFNCSSTKTHAELTFPPTLARSVTSKPSYLGSSTIFSNTALKEKS